MTDEEKKDFILDKYAIAGITPTEETIRDLDNMIKQLGEDCDEALRGGYVL